MGKNNISELTNEQLLIEKKKLKKSEFISALMIGFLTSIVVIGIVSSIISKNTIVIIPLLFPIYFIYKLISNSKKNNELKIILKERNLGSSPKVVGFRNYA
ncbi:hypothetical protein MPF19_18305 [Polaribacter sp. Z014]|uniref:hypothetical protein n=1 Tax=Polaribacter sp. Z014 TaxID=2927126 RepID=UPI0020218C8B|nr:hypothetical protein [Polaribacter sp. Z014]MCL7765379.1 hypothetical protein [Polaribacter sp. Z014]